MLLKVIFLQNIVFMYACKIIIFILVSSQSVISQTPPSTHSDPPVPSVDLSNIPDDCTLSESGTTYNLLSHLYRYTVDATHLAVLLEVLNDTACQWYNLGLQLGMNCFTLDAIEADQRGVKIFLREMLKAWLKGQGGKCTKRTLRTVLSNKTINCRIVDN